MYAFVDAERETSGVEPNCEVREIAPSGYRAYRAPQRDPTRRSARAQRDGTLRADIRRRWQDNHGVYGVRKIWHALRRKGQVVARGTVVRLMAAEGLQGVVRGRRVQATRPDPTADDTRDRVQRAFVAERPNQLWVADFTDVATWRGMVYVAFVSDVFSRRIVGWRAHTTMQTALVLDALEQARYDRVLDGAPGALVVHADRGSPYVSMRYTERLAEAGAAPSVGRVGDASDNALAESVIGVYTTAVIRRRGPWRRCDDVEFATLEWVAWFNTQRLLEPLGYVPPAEFETMYHETRTSHTAGVGLN